MKVFLRMTQLFCVMAKNSFKIYSCMSAVFTFVLVNKNETAKTHYRSGHVVVHIFFNGSHISLVKQENELQSIHGR